MTDLLRKLRHVSHVLIATLFVAGVAHADPDPDNVWVNKFGYTTAAEARAHPYKCTSILEPGDRCFLEFGAGATNGMLTTEDSAALFIGIPSWLCTNADTGGTSGTANIDGFYSVDALTRNGSIDHAGSSASNDQCHSIPAGTYYWGTVTTTSSRSVVVIMGQGGAP